MTRLFGRLCGAACFMGAKTLEEAFWVCPKRSPTA